MQILIGLWGFVSGVLGFAPFLSGLYFVRVKKMPLKLIQGFGLIFASINIILINVTICAVLFRDYLVQFSAVLISGFFILLLATAVYLFVVEGKRR